MDHSAASLDAREWTERGRGRLPGLLGLEVLEIGPGLVRARLDVTERHHAPNGYLHAATIIGLVDTACGYGCVVSLPEGATGFTTVELKSNFLGTVLSGGLACECTLAHGGRSTQVWDARAFAEDGGRAVALFRCTQLLLRGGS